ncbi:MAG: UTP--glucose-1-phosphate uridylyltransferase [Lachnospiraceae bacterium]|jgi:UDP-N-acetylglucosamine/UDP-N-acetylgalactosamine diphosphorylase
MDFNSTMARLREVGQEQLLRFYDELDSEAADRLLDAIDKIDFDMIGNRMLPENGEEIEPIEAITMDKIALHKEEYTRIGLDAIRDGRVAAVLLAGGQGTRLGIDGPKGAFDIGITRRLSIFQCLINNLMDVTSEAGCNIPLLIMTSGKNYFQTKDCFEQHGFFGYDRDYVEFFVQEMAPSTDFEGRILLEEKDRISLSPNGNGGWFKSLNRAGLTAKLKKRGVQWFNVFAVDNVLQRIADPAFIGATIKSGHPIGAKVVSKAAPDEKVGVMCYRNGRPSIIEYYELTPEMIERRNEDGSLAYNWGVILNYLLNLEALEAIEKMNLPFHMVEKKIPHIDENGNHVMPEEPNGYKYETLILDMISMMDGCLVYEVDRSREFAPIKNAVGKDSPESARKLLAGCGVEL